MTQTVLRAGGKYFKLLNDEVRAASGDITIEDCAGQRYIAAGQRGKNITINGTPGNALGAYLDGCHITVNGNAQDATGDTMNDGMIVINGSAGDALGYGMRGGKIYVRGYSGYRTGIHMKEYKDKVPVIIVGGAVGSFLGEYQAGGTIIVLGLGVPDFTVDRFTGTGQHGGRIFVRQRKPPENLPPQVALSGATDDDMAGIVPLLGEYAAVFSLPLDEIMAVPFYLLRPNANNPYNSMYTPN
ncbi:MAG: glutamate synthase [Clostridiales bacterium]|jgi:glutamate synthase domain-containing protein 3|nr:glutamate synthase [Clostridiales bacterium]